ncbi:hypothetical protein [Actimicrobium antarcticum]|uniref:Chromosome partitioning protein ParB n=1 Tax=Actimicrobium antarcticum TaxID=1051899 RepID=A0ABP7TMY4_9BURK
MNNKPAPAGHPASPAKKKPGESPDVISHEQPDEDALDEALEESFPASDPISVDITRVEAPPAKKRS